MLHNARDNGLNQIGDTKRRRTLGSIQNAKSFRTCRADVESLPPSFKPSHDSLNCCPTFRQNQLIAGATSASSAFIKRRISRSGNELRLLVLDFLFGDWKRIRDF